MRRHDAGRHHQLYLSEYSGSYSNQWCRLRAALEQTANYLAVENNQIVFNPAFIQPKPQYYNYDMYEGIQYTIDMKQPVGQRITELHFKGHPVLPQQMLEVVTNQYRAIGGGNYAMFGAEKIVPRNPKST